MTEEDLFLALDALGGTAPSVHWDTVTIGEGWSHFRDPGAFPDERDPASDRWARQHPAVDKFPSSRGSRGLREVAARVHGRGLRLALRVLPGIPTLAVRRHMTVYGSSARVGEIVVHPSDAGIERTGLNHGHPATQRWYDSQVALYASWGVDEIALVLRAGDEHYADLVALREAIDRCGGPMRLTLVGGASFVRAGAARLGNLVDEWQIGPAPIASWADVVDSFTAASDTTATSGAPREISLGELLLGDEAPLSLDEQRACSSLSALLGSSLSVSSTAGTLADIAPPVLGNRDLHLIRTTGATVLRKQVGQVHAWTVEAGRRRYAALLNLGSTSESVTSPLPALGLHPASELEDSWSGERVAAADGRIDLVLAPHSVRLLRAER